MNKPKTGGDVDAFCTKCRLELAHVIVAIATGRIVRVQCKTCGSVHGFRARTEGKASAGPRATPRVRAATRDPAAASLAQYESVMDGHDLSRARRYKPSILFAEGEVVDHATFGLGLCTRVLADNKVEVVFKGGTKVLAHGR